MIKLLPKSLIAEQKAKATTREIEEGMKIAKRVDALRENYSKTEQELEAYRTATLTAIQGEIEALNEKKEVLTGELRSMQSKYDTILPEINAKESALAQFEKVLRSWEKRLARQEDEISILDKETAEVNFRAHNSFLRQEDNERISRNLLIQAKERESEALLARTNAREIEAKSQSDQKDIEAAFILREFSIKNKEQELSKKECDLMNIKKGLEQEKIQINDQREALARSMARLKAGRLA